MKRITVLANSAPEALAEVYRQLGPAAVVVNVRKIAAPGLGRIWKKPQVELQAALPVRPEQPKIRPTVPASFLKSVEKWNRKAAPLPEEKIRPRERSKGEKIKDLDPEVPERVPTRPSSPKPSVPAEPAVQSAPTRLSTMLENLGLLPIHAQRLADQVNRSKRRAGEEWTLKEEFAAVQELLIRQWQTAARRSQTRNAKTRILVGAPGVGKTTCLCKWLTQEVLLQNRPAHVWRLDTHTANTAEFLTIHCEILGVRVDRVEAPAEAEKAAADLEFVDLPGIAIDQSSAIESLATTLERFRGPEILLTINAAYDLQHSLAQFKAFSHLPLSGLMLTHLDEETRWSRFWNLFLGTQLPVLYLSAGQNIPGDFHAASPQSLFDLAGEPD